MKNLSFIKKIIKDKYKNKLFSPKDIIQDLSNISKNMSRITVTRIFKKLKEDGVIQLVKWRKKGLYYVPRQTSLGLLPPREKYTIETLLKAYKAYISGVALYNKWNLTTQMPTEIICVSISVNYSKKRQLSGLCVKLVPSKVRSKSLRREDIKYLQYLDALNITKIPNPDPQILSILKKKIKNLSKTKLMKISRKYYPPRVNALLGAIIEENYKNIDIQSFKKEFTCTGSIYKIPIKLTSLPGAKDWNIIAS
ncbi:MAG: helix-turn-helix domain-containing protein [Bdellovibrionales bacterium]|nr:helix-turn-helix domain-containing protein [Bdellovibrionales bacterium]